MVKFLFHEMEQEERGFPVRHGWISAYRWLMTHTSISPVEEQSLDKFGWDPKLVWNFNHKENVHRWTTLSVCLWQEPLGGYEYKVKSMTAQRACVGEWWLYAIWGYCQPGCNIPTHRITTAQNHHHQRQCINYFYSICIWLVWLWDVTTNVFSTRSPFLHSLRWMWQQCPSSLEHPDCLLFFTIHQITTNMMKVPGTCHVGLLSHCQWINGLDLAILYGMPWQVFLTGCALHSGGLSFLWIAYHIRQLAMGMLLMWWSLVVSKDKCSCYDEKDIPMQQNPGVPGLFLPPSAKLSKYDHWFPCDGYTGMIQSEYIATGKNQPGEICRNGNEKVI
jgi:hypothetical protein